MVVIPAKAGIHSVGKHLHRLAEGIPAFAGMTSVSKGIPFQMTPAPSMAYASRYETSPPTQD